MYGMDGTMVGTAGGFQQMTQDALTVLNDIPFTVDLIYINKYLYLLAYMNILYI